MPETRGNIAIGAQQIGVSGIGTVTRLEQSGLVAQRRIITDDQTSHALGQFDRLTIRVQYGETATRPRETFREKYMCAVISRERRVRHMCARLKTDRPVVAIGRRE